MKPYVSNIMCTDTTDITINHFLIIPLITMNLYVSFQCAKKKKEYKKSSNEHCKLRSVLPAEVCELS